MTSPITPPIYSRKQPRQARSTELVAAILDAAIQVLAQEGATRFTTARVAQRAGVSVGSLYQYFPNKAAILFRLQADEWRQTTEMLCRVLKDPDKPPLTRLRMLVHGMVKSECDERLLRVALGDAAPLYRHAPEAQEAHAAGHAAFEAFMRELLPELAQDKRQLAGDLVLTTLSTVGKSFSEAARENQEIQVFSDAMADMLCTYLDSLR